MKPSVSITTTLVPTLLLAAAALWMGLQRQSRIETLRLEQARLSRAIDARFPQAHAHPTRSHRRADPVAEGRRALGELIELATHKDREPPDPEVLADLAERVKAMNATAIRESLDRILTDESIAPWIRRELRSYFLQRLMRDHPVEVIAHIDLIEGDLPEWLKGYDIDILRQLAARRWAEIEPLAAWDWTCEKMKGMDEAHRGYRRDVILGAIARSHPDLGLRIAREEEVDGIRYLGGPGQTIAAKLASYHAIRDHFGQDSEELRKGIEKLTLFRGHDRATPFAEATGWLAEAGLTADDLDFVRDPSRFDLCYYVDPVETGKWIDWLLRTFPGDSPGIRINRFFEDHRTKAAAREWLAAQPEETVRRVRPFIDSRR